MSKAAPLVVKQTRLERPSGSKDALVSFTSPSGESVSITLSPVAQTQLLELLLAGPKGQVVGEHFQLSRPPIPANSFQSMVLSNSIGGLEVGTPHGALFLSFDGPMFEQLKTAIRQLSPPSQSVPGAQSTKH